MGRSAVETRLVSRHFDRHAGEYDRYAVVQKQVARELLRRLPPGTEGPALDLGTGTGELARLLLTERPALELAVADIAHGMTRTAAARLPGVLALDGDAHALPLAADRFGLVLSSAMYQWVNDLEKAFTEAVRVLRRDGCFLVALFGERTLGELRTSHRLAAAERGRRPSHAQRFPRPDEVRRAMAAAGFKEILIESEDEVEHHPDVESLLRNLKRIGAQNAAADRPPGLGSRRVLQRTMEIYRERFARGGTIPATYQVIYARGFAGKGLTGRGAGRT